MKITIPGRVPSKKNSKRWIRRGNKNFLVPSEQHEAWHDENMWRLKKYAVYGCENVLTMRIKFYPPDRKRADLSNKAESIMDLLVDAGVLKDDNWFEVPNLSLSLGEVCPENPRAEIEINEFSTP